MRVKELKVSYHTLPGMTTPTKLSTPRAMAELLIPLLAQEASEVFMVVLLDTKNQLIAVHTVSRGNLDTCLVGPREVFRAALLANAAHIVTAHNHPSGDPTPSGDDLACWHRLNQSGTVLGVECLDHMIIGEGGRYYSQLESRGSV